MPTSLQEQMSPLLRRIAEALIQLTPESWPQATLRVEVMKYPNGDVGISHAICSERGNRDVVVTDDEVYGATRELQLLCDQAGQPWSAVVFRVEQTDGNWKFSTDFEYPS